MKARGDAASWRWLWGGRVLIVAAALLLSPDARAEGPRPVFDIREGKPPVVSAGLGANFAFRRYGIGSVFATLALTRRVDLLIEKGADTRGSVLGPLYPKDLLAYTDRDWWLGSARWFVGGSGGWFVAAGAADGTIRQTDAIAGTDAAIAEARFQAGFLEVGWRSGDTLFVTASIRLAKTRVSGEHVYVPARFVPEDFDQATHFSHARLGVGWHLF